MERSPVHYQYKGRYIMTAVKSGLMIIDQHRAHVRILYDRYLERLANKQGNPQKVLFPETFHLSASEQVALRQIWDELSYVGFDLSDLGGGNYVVNAVPSDVFGANFVALIHDLLNETIDGGMSVSSNMRKNVALELALYSAIPEGQVLNNDEMENIVNDLFACSNTNFSPNGKAILCILKQQEIERLMG